VIDALAKKENPVPHIQHGVLTALNNDFSKVSVPEAANPLLSPADNVTHN
jgi:hypothetical protein